MSRLGLCFLIFVVALVASSFGLTTFSRAVDVSTVAAWTLAFQWLFGEDA